MVRTSQLLGEAAAELSLGRTPKKMPRTFYTLILLALLATSCVDTGQNNNSTPVTPTPTAFTLTGTWAGDISVQGQIGRMTWTLTQSGTTVTGPVLVGLSNGVVLLNGTLNGTFTNNVLTYSITVGAGGIPTQPQCTGRLDGSATATQGSPSTLSGSYTVATSTCQTGFPGGSFVLSR